MSARTSKNYTIQKNVEMPKSGRMFGSFCPFKEMEVGDSFNFSLADEKRVQSLSDQYGRKNGPAFLLNITDIGTCWRVS